MEKVLSFSTRDRELFKAKLAQRNKGYDQWLRGPRGQRYSDVASELSDARQSGDQQKVSQLEAEYARLRSEQEALRLKLRREFNSALSLTQQQRWAGHVLFTSIVGRFKDADLSDEQKQQAFAVCVALAAQSFDEPALEKNPYAKPDDAIQDRASGIVHDHVLTTKQREKIDGVRAGR